MYPAFSGWLTATGEHRKLELYLALPARGMLVALALPAAAVLLAGCAFNTQQRTAPSLAPVTAEVDHPDPTATHYHEEYPAVGSSGSAPAPGSGHLTSYIEFDEQGDFWNRDQLNSALADIRSSKKPVILVIYAHGWENHSQSDDVWRFNYNLLQKIAQTPEIAGHYDVRGVYLGWNGKRLHNHAPPPLDQIAGLGQIFTFWGRKNDASQRVAGTCATEAIFSLARAAREQNVHSKVFLIGHSFGALVMERSLAQGLIGALMFQDVGRGGSKEVIFPADLVLLLNSAAESIYAKELIDFFHANRVEHVDEGFINPERPLIVSVTSSADWYTGVPFGIGTSFSNAAGTFRSYPIENSTEQYSQRQFLTHTAGHNTMLLSHDIIPYENNPVQKGLNAFAENLVRPKANRVFATEELTMKSGAHKGATQQWWQVKRLGNQYNQTPYWVVRSPAEICNGHTDVWNPSMVDMMVAFFRLAQPLTPLSTSGPTKMTIKSAPTSFKALRVEPDLPPAGAVPSSSAPIVPLLPTGQAPSSAVQGH